MTNYPNSKNLKGKTNDIEAACLVSIPELLKITIGIFGTNRRVFFGIVLITLFVNLLYYFPFLDVVVKSHFIMIVFYWLIGYLIHATLFIPIVLTADACLGKKSIELSQALLPVRNKSWPLIFTGILSAYFWVVGLLFLMMPIFWGITYLVFIAHFTVLEKTPFLRAIKASDLLVRKRRWKTYVRLMPPIVTFWVLIFANPMPSINSENIYPDLYIHRFFTVIIDSAFEMFMVAYTLVLFRDLQSKPVGHT